VRIEREIKLDYSDVLFTPKRSSLSSRSEVDLTRTYTFKNSGQQYTGIPIMAANMDGVGTLDMALALSEQSLFTCLTKSYQPAEIWEWLNTSDYKSDLVGCIAVSTGIADADFERVKATLKLSRSIRYVCIDVANGYSEKFLDFVEKFRSEFPTITIIAGNVVTPDVTEELILRGADIVKVGIGPGSVCTTRIKTGVGYPQLSAVIECADAAHGLGGHIIADGGCSCPGDVAKAFGAGADFVMLGGMLAGTDQGGGDVFNKFIEDTELHYEVFDHLERRTHKVIQKQFVQFYGMSSTTAQEKHGDGFKEYRASEGRVVQIPYRGDVQPIVGDILGGVRSTCTYVGAKTLKELSKRTTFVQVSGGKQFNDIFQNNTVGQ
jgi:GMP reductase